MKTWNGKKTFAVIFLLALFAISGISYVKLGRFYVLGEIDYNEWNASTGSKVETDYISNFWFKYQYVNLNGLVCRILGQQEMNGVVKLNNGYLNVTNDYLADASIEKYAVQTQSFSEHLADKGITYVYFTVPYVVDRYDSQMPTGIADYGNDNLDRISETFDGYGINVCDLRECLHEEGFETYDIFYRTDHHWTTEGGFWAYNEIMNYLEETLGYHADPEIGNLENYTITTYEEWHLGSRGQRTGKFYAGMDDFDLILPDFETYIQRWGTEEGGNLQSMMIDMQPLEKANYASRYTYDSVLGGSVGLWHNPTASVDKTLVIVSDSLSKSVNPYLALTFSNVISADASSINEDFLETYEPDVVISLNYITNAVGERVYSWGY